MFVVCSESAASSELAAAFPTACVLQTFADLVRPPDAEACAAIEYAIVFAGARHLVVCGHDGCRATGDAARPVTGQAHLLARCRALRAEMGPLLRRARVTMHALWLDEVSRDVFRCDLDGHPAERISVQALAAMVSSSDERAW